MDDRGEGNARTTSSRGQAGLPGALVVPRRGISVRADARRARRRDAEGRRAWRGGWWLGPEAVMIGRERVLDELSSRYERPGARGEGHTLTRLKWLAIVAPLAFLALLQYLLHSVLWHLHDFPGVLIVFALVALGIAVFSFGVFRVITRLERRILARNQELAALLAVGRAATSSPAFPPMFEEGVGALPPRGPGER